MTTPPNLRDVCACCGNCDHFDLPEGCEDLDCMKCMKHDFKPEHHAFYATIISMSNW